MNWMNDLVRGGSTCRQAAAPAQTIVETRFDVARLDARVVEAALEASVGTFRLPDAAGVAVVRSVHHAHPDVVVRTTVPGGATLDAVLRDERPPLAVRTDLVVRAVDAVVDALGAWTRLGPVHGAIVAGDVWVDARGRVTVDGFGSLAAWTQLARAGHVRPIPLPHPEAFIDLRAGSADVFAAGVLVGVALLGVPVPVPGGAVAFRRTVARRLEGPPTMDDGFGCAVQEMLDGNPALADLFGGGSDAVARVGRRLAPRLDDEVLRELARLVLDATALEPHLRLRPEALVDQLHQLQRHLDVDDAVDAWRASRVALPTVPATVRRPSWLEGEPDPVTNAAR